MYNSNFIYSEQHKMDDEYSVISKRRCLSRCFRSQRNININNNQNENENDQENINED